MNININEKSDMKNFLTGIKTKSPLFILSFFLFLIVILAVIIVPKSSWKNIFNTNKFATVFTSSNTLYNLSVSNNWIAQGNAWGENIGWLTLSPNSSSTIYVADDALSGYLYGENIGWVSLSCRNTNSCNTTSYGVSNDAQGNLSGFAYGENIGWIDFGTPNGPYQVKISATGTFSGFAYGENVGWINFGASPATTTWTPRSLRPQCNDGLDNDSNGQIDYPADLNCSSFADNSESSGGGVHHNAEPTGQGGNTEPTGQGGTTEPEPTPETPTPPTAPEPITPTITTITPELTVEAPSGSVVTTNPDDNSITIAKNETPIVTLPEGTTGTTVLTVSTTEEGGGMVIVSGATLPEGATKTVYVPKQLSSNYICANDSENIASISTDCDRPGEVLVPCSGSVGAITCTVEQSNYAVSGLSHSTVGEVSIPRANQTTQPATKTPVFTRNLTLGSIGNDVKLLQIYLNSRGFIVSAKGAGSKGLESTYYGERTRQAVKKYQEYYKDQILKQFNLTVGTGFFGEVTRKQVNNNY